MMLVTGEAITFEIGFWGWEGGLGGVVWFLFFFLMP